jgi:Xaa-Pro aminopeptidase
MDRLRSLKKVLRSKGFLPYLISDLKNIEYLTGFTGTYARLLVDNSVSYFISDSRYEEYARSILPRSVRFVLQKEDPHLLLRAILQESGRKSLYLEEHSLQLSEYLRLRVKLRGVKLVPGGDEVNAIRIVKDPGEIRLLREAAEITDRCFEHLTDHIRPGMTEWEIALEIEIFYRKNGCRKTSFDSIVASGKGSSMPHYQTSMKKQVERGDVILIDMGCEYRGYNSDLTRTVFIHSISPFFESIYLTVLSAQLAACDAVRPGITTGRLDDIARGIIDAEGYGENFGHSLGHGLGMEVHELPAVKSGDFRLKKNMAITIEPGIYVPGRGGVRIEDMVLVTEQGHEILTGSSKDIIVI